MCLFKNAVFWIRVLLAGSGSDFFPESGSAKKPGSIRIRIQNTVMWDKMAAVSFTQMSSFLYASPPPA